MAIPIRRISFLLIDSRGTLNTWPHEHPLVVPFFMVDVWHLLLHHNNRFTEESTLLLFNQKFCHTALHSVSQSIHADPSLPRSEDTAKMHPVCKRGKGTARNICLSVLQRPCPLNSGHSRDHQHWHNHVGRGGAQVHRVDQRRLALAKVPARDLPVPIGRLVVPRRGQGTGGAGVQGLGGP